MTPCPVCSTECPAGQSCPKCGWNGNAARSAVVSGETPVISADEHNCAHCGKSFSGQAVKHRGYMETPTVATPARLGHVCSSCGAVSCDACKKAGIGWSSWSGYEKAACQNCSAGIEAVKVVVAGSGDLCRAYGGETLQMPASSAVSPGAFSVKGGGEQIMNILWGLAALGGVGAMYFLVIGPSQGTTVEFDFKYPALVVGLLTFAIWEIARGLMNLSKASRRSVTLDKDGITQGGVTIAWSDIRGLKLFRKGEKLKPIAIVNGSEGQMIELAWATERLDHVMDALVSHLGADCQIKVD